jgi:hypothetical protein
MNWTQSNLDNLGKESPKPKRKIKNRPEQDLQKQCVRWFNYEYPNEILIHIPNGGKRNILEAIQFKKMGTVKGFPDLVLFNQSSQYGGLIIELKAKGEKASKEQKEMFFKLLGRGYKVVLIDSFEDFVKEIKGYLAP